MAIQELLVTLDGSYPNYHIFCVILLKYCCCYYIAVLKICKQQYTREVQRRWAFISVPQITHGRFSRGNHAILPNWIRYIHINFGISYFEHRLKCLWYVHLQWDNAFSTCNSTTKLKSIRFGNTDFSLLRLGF